MFIDSGLVGSSFFTSNPRKELSEVYTSDYPNKGTIRNDNGYITYIGELENVDELIRNNVLFINNVNRAHIVGNDRNSKILSSAKGLTMNPGLYKLQMNLCNPEGLVLNDRLRFLRINYMENAKGLNLKNALKTLVLRDLKTTIGLNLNDKLEELVLTSIESPIGLTLNKNLRFLSAKKLKTPIGLNLNDNLKSLALNSITNANGLVLNKGLTTLRLAGLETTVGLILNENIQNVSFGGKINIEEFNELKARYPNCKFLINSPSYYFVHLDVI